LIAQLLILVSAAIIGLLGAIHMRITFTGSKLIPRDAAVRTAMEETSPGITTQTTMWRAWIGFNASHSLGALLFASVYGYLAAAHPDLLFHSAPLLAIGALTLGTYVLLGRAYWFSTPYRAIVVAFACYVAGIAWSVVGRGT
jgi:hypothetical protein